MHPHRTDDLRDEWTSVQQIRNFANRGRAFESLVMKVVRARGFEVHRRPRAALPRESDLFASRNGEYLIETRYRAKPSGPEAIDELRSRLRRTANHVIGIHVSMSGFTGPALTAAQDRERLILLLDRAEFESLLAGASLVSLLRRKKTALVRDGRVLLGSDPREVLNLEAAGVPPPFCVFAGAASGVGWIASDGDAGAVVFVDDIPDIEWTTAQGRGVGFDLALPIDDRRDLHGLFETLRRMGWITGAGRFSISQTTRSWHGFGLGSFVDALDHRASRYRGMPGIHHREEAIYFDQFPDGLYTVRLDLPVASSEVRVDAADLSIQARGVPLDPAPYSILAETYELDENAFFRTLTADYSRVQMHRLEPRTLDVVELVLSLAEPSWVRGIVVRNPFSADGQQGEIPESLIAVARHELLLCALNSWHEIHQQPDYYELKSVENVWTADARVLRPIADWHELTPRPRNA